MDQKTEDLAAELKQHVEKITAFQTARGFTNPELVSHFRTAKNKPLLGSDSSWERLRHDNWQGTLTAEKWVPKLRQVIGQIEGGTVVQEVYTDTPFFKKSLTALRRLEGQGDRRQRCHMTLAPQGVGKTVFCRYITGSDESKVRLRSYVRLNPSCREKRKAICLVMARGMQLTLSRSWTEEQMVEAIATELRKFPRTVIIDEAHEGGLELMKLIRHWMDETKTCFMYYGYPTEYRKLVTDTVENSVDAEALQFLSRCLKPIFDDYQHGTKAADVVVVLKHNGIEADESTVRARLLSTLIKFYNIDVLIEAIHELSNAEIDDPTFDEVVDEVKNLCSINPGEEKKLRRPAREESK